MRSLRRLPSFAALLLIACAGKSPDVATLQPILVEDGRILELLQEADSLAARDAHGAAENLRQSALPRARANAEAAGRTFVEHSRAQALRRELLRVTFERRATIERYATALDGTDPIALSAALRDQARLDRAMDQLESDVQEARNAPPDSSCARR